VTPFTEQDKYANPLDWTILRDGGLALYWRREFFDEDVNWFQQQKYRILLFDCALWHSNDEMHTDLRGKLGFPDYYGMNFDALLDEMEDLEVSETGGVTLGLAHFDAYAKGPGAAPPRSGRPSAEILLDVLARASRYFLLTGQRMVTLIQTDDPRSHFDSLGCVCARWNWREFLNKDRGI